MSDPKKPSDASPEDVEEQLDEALEDTFPASDPVSIEAPGHRDSRLPEGQDK